MVIKLFGITSNSCLIIEISLLLELKYGSLHAIVSFLAIVASHHSAVLGDISPVDMDPALRATKEELKFVKIPRLS